MVIIRFAAGRQENLLYEKEPLRSPSTKFRSLFGVLGSAWRPLLDFARVLRAPIILGLILTLAVAACTSSPTPTPTPPPIEKAIVGQWVNAQGGAIYFYADNTGFIPGIEAGAEPVPDSKFTYYFQDKTHLGIVMEGQSAIVIEIRIEGDKMTWRSRINNTEFVYQRAR